MTTWLQHPHANGSHRFDSVWQRSADPSTHPRSAVRGSVRLGLVVSLAAVTVAVLLAEFAGLSVLGLTISVAIGALLVGVMQVTCFGSGDGHRRTEPDPHDHRRLQVPLGRAA